MLINFGNWNALVTKRATVIDHINMLCMDTAKSRRFMNGYSTLQRQMRGESIIIINFAKGWLEISEIFYNFQKLFILWKHMLAITNI